MADFFVHESSYADEGCQIGAGTKIWHFSHVMSGARIGERCNIGQNVVISPQVVIGNNVKIQNNVSVYTGVTLEDDVFCGPSMVFTNVVNPRSQVSRKDEYRATLVKRGASLGANCTVVCGHTIGAYAFVGAGAVITKDVPDYALVVGNPGRVVGLGLRVRRQAGEWLGGAAAGDVRDVRKTVRRDCRQPQAARRRGRGGLIRLLLLFAAVNLGLLAVMGVRIGGDSGIYTDGARALIDGQALTARQPSYLGYIAVVAFFQSIGAGLTGVVIAQVTAATAAAYAVYRMALELGGRLAGVSAVLLLTVDVDSSRWHAYVLSDSLYASVLAIAAWLVHRASGAAPSPRALRFYVSASLALLAAGLIRPEGWFLVPVAASYVVIRKAPSPATRWLGFGAVAGACLLLVTVLAPILGGNLQAVGPGEMLRRGNTIWDYDGWRLTMPADPLPDTGSSAITAVSYAVAHPLSTAALMAARVGVHFAHVRPYYSTAHNVAIAAWLIPIYALGAYGWWRMRANPLAWWCVAVVGTQTAVVALTHADWDGRYLSHVMPLWYPFAAAGIVAVAGRRPPGAASVAA